MLHSKMYYYNYKNSTCYHGCTTNCYMIIKITHVTQQTVIKMQLKFVNTQQKMQYLLKNYHRLTIQNA